MLADDVQQKFTDTATQLAQNAQQIGAVVSPSKYGAKMDGVTDDLSAVQQAYTNAGAGGIIDFGGKTCFISAPLHLTSQDRLFRNGGLTSNGNTIEAYTQYCWGNNFDHFYLKSNNGYAYYAAANYGGTEEVFNDRFVKTTFEGYLGAFYTDGMGFHRTFTQCTAKSANGHGFIGIKGPGTVIVACDNGGIPNGALFYNCFDCKIQNSDSNGEMKYGVLIDKFVPNFYAEGCNFEHCSNEGVKITTQINTLTLKNTSVSQTTTAGLAQPTAYPLTVAVAQNLDLENVSINNYTGTNADIYLSGAPKIKAFNSRAFSCYNNSYYRNKLFNIPDSFHGTNQLDQITDDNSNYFIKGYPSQLIEIGNIEFGAFVQNPTNVTQLTDLDIDFKRNPSTLFYITNNSITQLQGVKNTYSTPILGEGTMITIVNKTTGSITLKHNITYSNIPFLLLTSADTSLAINSSATFIVVNVSNSLKLKQLY
jgi:hypothetical protein